MNHCGMQSFSEDIDALCDLAVELSADGPVRAVEVGTWVGATACRLADVGCRVTCVDWFEGTKDPEEHRLMDGKTFEELYGTFRANVGDRLWRSVFPIVGETTGVPWVCGPFDLCFIDADHRYECVMEDIARWEPCVRPGGIVACHDLGLWRGVTKAVKERRGDNFTLGGKSLAWWRV